VEDAAVPDHAALARHRPRAAPAGARARLELGAAGVTTGDDVLDRPVHAGGADRRFGELTADDARAHAAELRSAAGWGPTARVATVAQAWRELADELAQAGAATVADLGGERAAALAERLWVVPPGGSLLR
jgi:hypothetical protein